MVMVEEMRMMKKMTREKEKIEERICEGHVADAMCSLYLLYFYCAQHRLEA